MCKRIFSKLGAVFCSLAVLSASSICVNAVEADNVSKDNHIETDGERSSFDSILPPTEAVYNEYLFDIDLPTGAGSATIQVNLHYYDHENSYGYAPGLTAAMLTTVTCDMGVDITIVNQWGETLTLDKDVYQTTAFRGRATHGTLNSVWEEIRINDMWACDDMGDAIFTPVGENINF